jgi:hypothetical protein
MQEDAYERCAVGVIWELCIEGLRAQLYVRVASLDGRKECQLQRAVKPPEEN